MSRVVMHHKGIFLNLNLIGHFFNRVQFFYVYFLRVLLLLNILMRKCGRFIFFHPAGGFEFKNLRMKTYFAKKLLLETVKNEQFFSPEFTDLEIKILPLSPSETLLLLSLHLSEIVLLTLESGVPLSLRRHFVL